MSTQTKDDITEMGIQRRTRCREKIYEALQGRTELKHDELTERARKIEMSVYNRTIRDITDSAKKTTKRKPFPKKIVFGKGDDELERTIKVPEFKKAKKYKIKANWECYIFCSKYTNKVKNIIWNINDTRNDKFIQSIIDKTIPLREIANLTPEEIFPEYWKPIKERVAKKEVILGVAPNVNDGIAQCGKCKSYKTTYYSLQTRSADEPMTNFFTCHNCGKRWKT